MVLVVVVAGVDFGFETLPLVGGGRGDFFFFDLLSKSALCELDSLFLFFEEVPIRLAFLVAKRPND